MEEKSEKNPENMTNAKEVTPVAPPPYTEAVPTPSGKPNFVGFFRIFILFLFSKSFQNFEIGLTPPKRVLYAVLALFFLE